jgi:hypothetical protein
LWNKTQAGEASFGLEFGCCIFNHEIDCSGFGGFWIDATATDTMKLSFQDISNELEARASGVDESAESAVRWLSRIEHKWLLVFDNADSAPKTIANFIPPGGSR